VTILSPLLHSNPQQRPPPGTPINRGHPLYKYCIGAYPLNERGGERAIDHSRLGYHGIADPDTGEIPTWEHDGMGFGVSYDPCMNCGTHS